MVTILATHRDGARGIYVGSTENLASRFKPHSHQPFESKETSTARSFHRRVQKLEWTKIFHALAVLPPKAHHGFLYLLKFVFMVRLGSINRGGGTAGTLVRDNLIKLLQRLDGHTMVYKDPGSSTALRSLALTAESVYISSDASKAVIAFNVNAPTLQVWHGHQTESIVKTCRKCLSTAARDYRSIEYDKDNFTKIFQYFNYYYQPQRTVAHEQSRQGRVKATPRTHLNCESCGVLFDDSVPYTKRVCCTQSHKHICGREKAYVKTFGVLSPVERPAHGRCQNPTR